MAQSSKWYTLPALPNLPPLLVSFAFTKSSYALHVTDLANIWAEKLDRRGILLRSLQENTSIDLSDADPEQWTVFLSKLNAAFDPTSPDHHLTSLTLAPDGNDALALRITCKLPKPLEPLRWPVQLTKCPSTKLASELVLPLIHAHHLRHQEAQDLMAQLREKDVVINKFIDKLAATRTGLEHIFTSLSAKQKVSREAANKKIKGLAPFDEAQWREERQLSQSQDPQELLQDVFGTSGVAYQQQTDLDMSDRLDDWWKSFRKALSTPAESKPDTPRKESQRAAEDAREQSKDEDEDFQVQATPPHLQARLASRGTRHKGPKGDETESDDSDDSDEPIPDSHPIHPQPETRPKIGALGKKKATAQTQSASQSSHTIPAEDDNATATESENDEDDEDSSPPKAAGRTGRRMGVIGKTRRSLTPSTKAASPARPPVDAGNDDSAPGPSSDTDSDSASASDSGSKSPIVKSKPTAMPRKGGLGRIGGKSRPPPDAPREETSTFDKKGGEVEAPRRPETRKIGAIGTKRSNAASSNEPKEPETEEQRAERKRAELANELEQKSKAPAKKKRKF
ncbi:XLF-domain-containing protein [Xylariaceae sp. FL1272]|nr:XLF-domain-containing protein [Xylariaceae sp. FL1272]